MKPILFNTAMVQAILAGRKTVTRRVVKTQHKDADGFLVFRDGDEIVVCDYAKNGAMYGNRNNPPYQSGDILYVREAWGIGYDDEYIYRADDKLADNPTFKNSTKMIYHPSIHMPKEAARIFLRVTSVSTEKLQDITKEQAGAEGVDYETDNSGLMRISQFVKLWNSTIKKNKLPTYGWKANPWVWVIEFEQINKEEAERGN